MTQLPFEDLPEKPARSKPDRFDEFWHIARRKVAKAAARRALVKALTRADETVIFDAWREANARWRIVDGKFIPYPASWLNGDRWEDEYDTPHKVTGTFQGQSLETIAEIAKKPWARCRYPRDVLEQCVEAGLLTVEEMAAAL